MERFSEGQKIGRGKDKDVFISKENSDIIIANFRDKKSNEQIKSAFYLAKLAHIFFPDNVPDIHAAFNDEEGKGTLYLENAHPDEEHKQINRWRVTRELDNERVRLNNDYHDKNIADPEIKKLVADMESKGLLPDNASGLNFGRSEDGDVLHLDTEPGYIKILNTRILRFRPDLLKKAIEELPEGAQKQQALNYYDRLIKLTTEEEKEEE
ncbi:MAG: hypothetical protein IT410_01840 [Candidatus Doudnabacteria bacterium]|nr:hypothetical protein [Candidatus Doudnabacteria bacterium]